LFGSDTSGLTDLALNLAIMYGKSDPRYAPILLALGINNADDLKRFLNGDISGANLGNIVSFLAIQQGKQDPAAKDWMSANGVTDIKSARSFISASDTPAYDSSMIFQLAYEYAAKNPQYAAWLEALNIHSGADLEALFKGAMGNAQGGQAQASAADTSNLQAVLMNLAMQYIAQNPKYAPYAAILAALLAQQGGGASAPGAGLNLGASQGLSASQIGQIVQAGAKK
jgi:hypothetical protein